MPRAFTAECIRQLAPDIEAVVRDLIDALPSRYLDLIEHFWQPRPVRIIARLLGVPEAARRTLLQWSNAMVAMYQARRSRLVKDEANRAARAFTEFLSVQIDEKRLRPEPYVIS